MKLVEDTLSAVLLDADCVSAYLFFREGPVVALRGPLSLPVDPNIWRVHLARSRRGRVHVAIEPAFAAQFLITSGVTRRLILASGRIARPGFKSRRAFREAASDLRRRLEDLIRRDTCGRSTPHDDSPSGLSGWAAVPLPPFMKPN